MNTHPWELASSTWPEVRDASYAVAVLPWGATEAHNTHLPYATDTLQSEGVVLEAARLAWQEGTRVAVLPAIPFGVQTGQRELPLCINLDPSTQARILTNVAESVAGSGVRKLVSSRTHSDSTTRFRVASGCATDMHRTGRNRWWILTPRSTAFASAAARLASTTT